MENQYVDREGAWRYDWDCDLEFYKHQTGVEKVDNIIKSIMENIPFIDIKPYSHNIISCNLQHLNKIGHKEIALDIIRLTPLIDLGWGYMVKKECKNLKKKVYDCSK